MLNRRKFIQLLGFSSGAVLLTGIRTNLSHQAILVMIALGEYGSNHWLSPNYISQLLRLDLNRINTAIAELHKREMILFINNTIESQIQISSLGIVELSKLYSNPLTMIDSNLERQRAALYHTEDTVEELQKWIPKLHGKDPLLALKFLKEKRDGDFEKITERILNHKNFSLIPDRVICEYVELIYSYYDRVNRWKDWQKIGDIACQMAESIKDIPNSIYLRILFCMGISHRMLGNTDRAIELYKDVLSKSPEKLSLKADILSSLADVYRLSGEYPNALNYASLALSTQEISNISRAKALEYKGLIHTSMGRFDLAINSFTEAYEIYLLEENLIRQMLVLDFLCSALVKRATPEDLYQALKQLQKAFDIAQKLDDQQRLYSLYAHQGNAYLKQNQLDNAIEAYRNSLSKSKEIFFDRGAALAHIRLAKVHWKNSDWQQTLDNIRESMDKENSLASDDFRVVGSELQIAVTCNELANFLRKPNQKVANFLKDTNQVELANDIDRWSAKFYLYPVENPQSVAEIAQSHELYTQASA